MRSVLYEQRSKSPRKGAQFVRIRLPTVCNKHVDKNITNTQAFDNVSLRERFVRIIFFCFQNKICAVVKQGICIDLRFPFIL